MKNSFILHFAINTDFKKGEVLASTGRQPELVILKVYKNVWWRKLLLRVFGHKTKLHNCLKVRENG